MPFPSTTLPETQVTPANTPGEAMTDTVGLSTGSYVVTNARTFDVAIDLFRADGTAFVSDLVLTTNPGGTRSAWTTVIETDNGFFVLWDETKLQIGFGGDPGHSDIKGQFFDVEGTPTSSVIEVNTTDLGAFAIGANPQATLLANGNIAVTWIAGAGSAMRGQILDQTGAFVGSELDLESTTSALYQNVTALPNGNFVATWSSDSSHDGDDGAVLLRAFSPTGTALGTASVVNTSTTAAQNLSDIIGFDDGRFLVLWTDASGQNGDADPSAIKGQLFDATGTASGGELLINTLTQGSQTTPAAALLPDGRYVVTWMESSTNFADTDETGIVAQVFNDDGTSHGAAFQVNTSTVGEQDLPSVDATEDGRFVITWGSFDGADEVANMRVFDMRDAGVTVGGTDHDDMYLGTAYVDTLSGGLADDTLYGYAGADTLDGGFGHDILWGGAGIDTIYGGNQGDTLLGHGGGDDLRANRGNDEVRGGSGADQIRGGWGADDLRGNGGADSIKGERGSDTILGGGGNDTIMGGTQKDILTGGNGADVFEFRTLAHSQTGAGGRDRITDFNQGVDTIDVSAIDAQSGPGNQTFDFIGNTAFSGTAGELRYSQANGKTFVLGDVDGDLSADFEIELTGLIALTASDFVL